MYISRLFERQTTLRSLARRLNLVSNSHQVSPDDHSNDGNKKRLFSRVVDVVRRTWDLGFIAFGGPPSHIRILHQRFVEGRRGKEKWVDEQTFQELFAIAQALPGPASTKMLFCLALFHAGFLPALFVFFIWSLPGAIGMYGLAVGVQHIQNTGLPGPVYALLSGINASTVGIIALAAVQLAEKAIRDRLSRILVIFGACAGLCYNALWFFPAIIVAGGFTAIVWDGWMERKVKEVKETLSRRRRRPSEEVQEDGAATSVQLEELSNGHSANGNSPPSLQITSRQPVEAVILSDHMISVKIGFAIVVFTLGSLTALLIARSKYNLLPLDLFANMYLAGTIIFGGGPVVIPLLRSYVVGPGWVSGRDFLLGLAIIQAFPGPNFNFAVYLGALSLQGSSKPMSLGAFLGFLGIFFPGISLAVAAQGFWRVVRSNKYVSYVLRGINASAVGLVFTAVYRLWEIGYLTPGDAGGKSLATEPWWVVVAALTYAESAWFDVPPPFAIVLGGVLGLAWYGAVGR